MNTIMNIFSAVAAIALVAALLPFGAAILVMCAALAIAGILASVVTGNKCVVVERKTTRTVETDENGTRTTRTVITTNRNGKTTTEVVES